MSNVYIYDAGWTAFSRYGEILSGTRPDDLLAHIIKTLVQRNNFGLALYEDVIAGGVESMSRAPLDLRQLEKTGGKYALATMCIGIGQGIAAVIERV